VELLGTGCWLLVTGRSLNLPKGWVLSFGLSFNRLNLVNPFNQPRAALRFTLGLHEADLRPLILMRVISKGLRYAATWAG